MASFFGVTFSSVVIAHAEPLAGNPRLGDTPDGIPGQPEDDVPEPPPTPTPGSNSIPSLTRGSSTVVTSLSPSLGSDSSRENVEYQGATNFYDEYQGWPFEGYGRTPILFDLTRDGKKRKYPNLSFDTQVNSNPNRKTSLKLANLGVDDEVQKSALAVFVPLSKLQNDLANDPNERERFLNLFKTYNGIAKLTLSYLDKTVAAGLEVTQQQVNSASQSQILKQLALTSSQIANPERAMLYRDVDEKFEACLAYGGPANAAKKNTQIQLVCPTSCLEKGSGGRSVTAPTQWGAGLFSYCACCAQSAEGLNFRAKNDKTVGTSLVNLALFGDNQPDGEHKSFLTSLRNEVVEMYGDRVLVPCDKTCVGYKVEYALPRFSVSEKIKIFRDGACYGDTTACEITRTKIKHGICPSIERLIAAKPEQLVQKKEELVPFWVEASLGRVVNASTIKSIRTTFVNGTNQAQLPTLTDSLDLDLPSGSLKWPPNLRRWLDDWCDASAVAAFKKYHYRINSLVEDHLRLNQKASEVEKAQFRDLIDRVSFQIQLAERDRSSDGVARSQLNMVALSAENNEQSEIAAVATALNADTNFGGSLGGAGPFYFSDSGSVVDSPSRLRDSIDPRKGDGPA